MSHTRFSIRSGFIIGLILVFVATTITVLFLNFGFLPDIGITGKNGSFLIHALSIVCIVVVMVTGMIIVLHRQVFNPLRALVDHMRAVRSLDAFWDRLRFRSHDELGFLAVSFNRLLHHIQLNTNALTKANEELEKIARTDRLTGLANRRMFEDQLSKELRRMLREKRGSINKGRISILICDVDFFKQFNDHYGHMAGDACLSAIGSVLQACIRRAGDLACRFGGEEFIFMLPDCDTLGAMKVGEIIRSSVVELGIPHIISTVAPIVTISVGVASAYVEESFDINGLLEASDRALYKAKAAGRNRVVCSD
jgi:diguanylate cyclase (GGDEF)-like protein